MVPPPPTPNKWINVYSKPHLTKLFAVSAVRLPPLLYCSLSSFQNMRSFVLFLGARQPQFFSLSPLHLFWLYTQPSRSGNNWNSRQFRQLRHFVRTGCVGWGTKKKGKQRREEGWRNRTRKGLTTEYPALGTYVCLSGYADTQWTTGP